MAAHIRNCVRCQVGLPCKSLDGMLAQMTDAEVFEAATEVIEQRRSELVNSRRYQREYMREWRKNKKLKEN